MIQHAKEQGQDILSVLFQSFCMYGYNMISTFWVNDIYKNNTEQKILFDMILID